MLDVLKRHKRHKEHNGATFINNETLNLLDG